MPQIFDMMGWTQAAPGTGAVQITAGLNDFLRHNADLDGIITLPRHQWLIGLFYATCATGERAMLRQTGLNLDHEFIKGALMGDNDPSQGYSDHFGVPLPIVAGETLWALSDNAGDEDTIIGAMIGSSAIRTSAKEAISATDKIIGQGDQAGTALTWTQADMTWNQTPKKGRYAILGMKAGLFEGVHGASLSLVRLLVPGMLDWRPGVPSAIMEADHEEYQSVTAEPWHIWGQLSTPRGVYSFTDDQLPNIEFLSVDSMDDQNVELLIRRIGDR